MVLKELSLALCKTEKIRVISLKNNNIIEYEDDDALWNSLRHNKELAKCEVTTICIHKGVLDITIKESR